MREGNRTHPLAGRTASVKKRFLAAIVEEHMNHLIPSPVPADSLIGGAATPVSLRALARLSRAEPIGGTA